MTTRRTVLTYLPLAALIAVLPARAADEPSALSPEWFQKHTAPEGSSFFLSQVPKSERGDRMVIRGVVMGADKKPIPNASVYIYHTDNEGRYDPAEPRPGLGSENPRLHGYLRTDSVGRYVYGSVRPVRYPNSDIPARVHFVVRADGFKDLATDMWFEGDPQITGAAIQHHEGGGIRFDIRPAVRDSNRVWQITNDIVLERK